MELFEKWDLRETGLFTFAHSPKHIGLYQKFGILAAIPDCHHVGRSTGKATSAIKFSGLNEEGEDQALRACRNLTDSI